MTVAEQPVANAANRQGRQLSGAVDPHVVLGLHVGHDATAALVVEGELVAAVAEERLSRIKVYVLQLHARDVPQVSGWSVRIDYDPEELSYVEGSFAPGSFLRRLTPLERVGEGYVEAGGDALAGESLAKGRGVLGTLSFEVGEGFSGQSELSVSRVTWHRDDWIGLDRNVVYASANITAADATFVNPADFNTDGSVDTDDFLLFADQFGHRVPPAEPRFDLDGNGRIDQVDFFLFADLVLEEE